MAAVMTGKQRVLAAIEGKPTDRLPLMPITMMFAADRIGQKYGKYATDHRVMAEAQIRTAEEFDLDFVSGISDPAREAAERGGRIQYFDDQPPAIDEHATVFADKSNLGKAKMPDPFGGGRMHDRVQAVAIFTQRVGGQKLNEGWIEGPCAQGADLRGLNTLMLDFMDDPPFVRDLFEFAIELELRFAKAQIDAGADIIGLGDAAASLAGPKIYEELIWPYEKRLVDAVRETGVPVRLHICGNTRPILEGMGQLGCQIIDLDWMVPMDEARARIGPEPLLLGNIDPVAVLRNGTPESVYEAIRQCHEQAGPRYVVGAGCEVVRDTPLDNMRELTRYARDAVVD